MRIMVTGADGQLGNCIRNAAEGSEDEYIFTDVDDVDITDAEAVDLCMRVNDFDVVINCAAFTDVERAEDPKMAPFVEKLNAEGVRNLARACKENDMTLIHISTDYVFGGSQFNTPRGENEVANPTGVYGLTKLHGERAIEETGCKALIFRTAWLYSEYGKNFVKTMLSLTSSSPELNVVVDQVGSPTYAQDLADAIVGIITERKFAGREGIFNYSNEGVCSWFDFAKMIAEISAHDTCDIRPCRSHEFPSAVVRPAYSVLDKSKFKNTFGLRIPYWVNSVRKCIKNLQSDEA